MTAEPRLLPPRLRPGDTVLVCSPAQAGAIIAPRRFARGTAWLQRMGFDVRLGDRTQVPGASPQRRADELNAAFADPSVRGVVTTIGGYTTNGVLAHLDYDAVAADPIVVVGYSDISAMLLALQARVGLVTFHGPTLMPEIAEWPEPIEPTGTSFLRAVCDPRPLGRLQPPTGWTDEFAGWDVGVDRARELNPHPGWTWLGSGRVRGPLWGGNLETICALVGTPNLRVPPGGVFFWETAADNPEIVERCLVQLRDAGVLRDISGVVVGRTFRAGPQVEQAVHELAARWWADTSRPVVCGVDLGHCDPMLTLPIGCDVELDSDARRLEVVDAAVR